MGGMISWERQIPASAELMDDLKLATLKIVNNARGTFTEMVAATEDGILHSLDVHEFDEVFQCIFGDTEAAFAVFKNSPEAVRVDAYEVFSALYLYCSSSQFRDKYDCCFDFFDIDSTTSTSLDEVTHMLMSASRGMCKVCGMVPPSVKLAEEMAMGLFNDMDADHDQHITKDEALGWLLRNEVMSLYVTRFVDDETFRRIAESQQQYNHYLRRVYAEFSKALEEQGGDGRSEEATLPLTSIHDVFCRAGVTMTVDEVLKYLKGSAGEFVNMREFAPFAACLLSFIVCDAGDKDDKLDTKEMQTLFW